MATQLQKLPINTQNVLKLAACIGNQFDLETLAIVHEKSQAETAADLWRSLQESLIIPITESYKFFQDSESVEVAQGSELSVPYRFLHDRVQQAAYFLIPEDQKQSTHLKIGRLLLSNIPQEEREEKIFDIVNQLNIRVELITHQTERNELASLNLIAGRKAKASTAYAAAKRYLTAGLELLAGDSWLHQYDLTLALHEEMIVVRADGKLECIDTIDLGFPISLVEEIGEFIAQTEVQLNPRDVVVLYTDRIPEAKDINKGQYGLKRLWQVVVKNRHHCAQEIREAVINDVRQYIGTQKVFDDITLVVMKQK